MEALQSLQRDAFTSVTDRPQEDIAYLVQWEDPKRYYDAHIDPNTVVGKRVNPNQSYTRQKIAVATEAREPIAFAYTAHNVSGAYPVDRLIKRLSVVRNYLWLREFAVRPDYQRQGVAKQLGLTVLKDAIELQPVAAYLWPDEIDFLPSFLNNLGFSPKSERQVHLYGESKSSVRQVRMQAPSERGVISRLG